MNHRVLLSVALTLTVATPPVLFSADTVPYPNRLSFGVRFGLNYQADFQNSATYFNPVSPGTAIAGVNHQYDDGYVRVDASGNFGGLTSYWGYQNAGQVVGTGMEFHALGVPAPSSVTENPQHGLELIYQRILGTLPGGNSGCWGLEFGFGYTEIDLYNPGSGTASVLTDTYPLGGVQPPLPGYQGTSTGPGALLGGTPVRTVGAGTVGGYQELTGRMYGFRVGPYGEWDLAPNFGIIASAGFTLAPTRVDYNFAETITLANGSSYSSSGSGTQKDNLYGPYASLMIRLESEGRWGIYVGAQVQSLNSLEQTVGTRTATLDPGATISLSAGFSRRF